MKIAYISNFNPLTTDEIKQIIELKRNYDHVDIYVNNCEQSNIPYINRFRTVREIYTTDDLCDVYMYDYNKSIEDNISKEVDKVLTTIKLESMDININSFTELENKINQNPYKYFDQINKFFKKYYTKKVLIYGTASTGKTTLTKDLAHYYNTSYSLEYAREYQVKYNVTDDELDIRDLTNIGIGQFNQNKMHIFSPATNKIFFADTDVMTTLNYVNYYASEEEEYDAVVGIFTGLIKKQEWDLVLFMQPDTAYVNDGFRDMNHSNESFRQNFNNIFKQTLNDHNVEFVELYGSFTDKFKYAVKLCDELIKED